eukprot:gnl/Spiro4/3917_TR1945_c1_g1_i1.p1 gnl/Spiro4/3917_TR1945_c1_g1~~gnl/Spiro4/3917_TR1945_c1_g1_i1.p1  ORF type:complete len:481 (+),score=96.96 gnl/Spiro4/3917_TR1945_c1_g1_i1:52-1443(+)
MVRSADRSSEQSPQQTAPLPPAAPPLRVLYIHGIDTPPGGGFKCDVLRELFGSENVACPDMQLPSFRRKAWWQALPIIVVYTFVLLISFWIAFQDLQQTSLLSTAQVTRSEFALMVQSFDVSCLFRPCLIWPWAVVAVGVWGFRAYHQRGVRAMLSMSIAIQRQALEQFKPDLVVGSSWGGCVALHLMHWVANERAEKLRLKRAAAKLGLGSFGEEHLFPPTILLAPAQRAVADRAGDGDEPPPLFPLFFPLIALIASMWAAFRARLSSSSSSAVRTPKHPPFACPPSPSRPRPSPPLSARSSPLMSGRPAPPYSSPVAAAAAAAGAVTPAAVAEAATTWAFSSSSSSSSSSYSYSSSTGSAVLPLPPTYPGVPAIPAGVPCLVVHGQCDDVIPIEDSRELLGLSLRLHRTDEGLRVKGAAGTVALIELENDDHSQLEALQRGEMSLWIERVLQLSNTSVNVL